LLVSFSSAAFANDSYLAVPVAYQSINAMKKILVSKTQTDLRDRGEAHITVLGPEEVRAIAPFVSMAQIKNEASKAMIYGAPIQPLCVGHGQASDSEVYFVVVSAPELLKFRVMLQQTYQIPSSAFKAAEFYPHITIGFTHRDLFPQDGVIKDQNSCRFSLNEIGVNLSALNGQHLN
jgi:hypothetical protein